MPTKECGVWSIVHIRREVRISRRYECAPEPLVNASFNYEDSSFVTQAHESTIESPMHCLRKRDSISYAVGSSGRHRPDVCGVRFCPAIAVGKHEASECTPTRVNLLDHSKAERRVTHCSTCDEISYRPVKRQIKLRCVNKPVALPP
jgi:hypothetical protein